MKHYEKTPIITGKVDQLLQVLKKTKSLVVTHSKKIRKHLCNLLGYDKCALTKTKQCMIATISSYCNENCFKGAIGLQLCGYISVGQTDSSKDGDAAKDNRSVTKGNCFSRSYADVVGSKNSEHDDN